MKVVKTLGKGMVPRAGVEPARPFGQRILSPQRLPFRHPGMSSVNRIIPRNFRFPKTPISCYLRLIQRREKYWPGE